MSDSNLPQAGDVKISPAKKRHGCLTAWLVLLVVLNALGSIFIFISKPLLAHMGQSTANLGPSWAVPVAGAICLLQLICVLGIFMWKKWGFYGYAVIAAANVVANAMQGKLVSGLIGAVVIVGILYLMLQIGKEDKGWPQLD